MAEQRTGIEEKTHSQIEQEVKIEARILFKVFTALFVQLFVLILISFILQSGPVYVTRYHFGLDFNDFYVAAKSWLTGENPYLRGRLFTPPSSMLLGLVLTWGNEGVSVFVFFLANLFLIFASVKRCARWFGLDNLDRLLLYGCVCLFYPVYFLIERGNLDGIMLALLVFGFTSARWWVRSLALGVSMGTKVYSALLFGLMALKKSQWKVLLLALATFVVLQLPFLGLEREFVKAVVGRGEFFRGDENLSPAVVFRWLIHDPLLAKLAFVLFWFGTLSARVWRDRGLRIEDVWQLYLPWMIAFPAQVFPYTGVLVLPLLASVAKACRNRQATRAEEIALLGMALIGFQAVAWSDFLGNGNAKWAMHGVCAFGTILLVAGTAMLRGYECTSDPLGAAQV